MSPCQSCGACCASFRVSFPESEIDNQPGGYVPAGLTEMITASQACMLGTGAVPVRCRALSGTIGVEVRCAIYEFRPQVCRDFAPLAAVGEGDEACNAARRRHRLPPLSRSPRG